MEDGGIEKMEDLDDVQGDCNKEKYIQRVVLLEQGTLFQAFCRLRLVSVQ